MTRAAAIRGETPANLLNRVLISLAVFITGLFCGTLVTALAPMTPRTWFLWVGLRLLWVFGGGIWCGYELGTVFLHRALFVLGMIVISSIFSFNPLADAVAGPQTVAGQVVQEQYQRERVFRFPGMMMSPTIHVWIVVQSAGGQTTPIVFKGFQANRWQKARLRLNAPGSPVTAIYLKHLRSFLDLKSGPAE